MLIVHGVKDFYPLQKVIMEGKRPASGYIVLYRDRTTKGVYATTVRYLESVLDEEDCRILYCQGVGNYETVQHKVDKFMEEDLQEDTEMNERITSLINGLQWIANEHPLQCFRPVNQQQDCLEHL